MGQKVNPISLRLQKTNRHFDSCWYDDYNYTHLLLQDLKIQNYLKTVLHQIKYPESRIYTLGYPKKNIINLFYYNPSNSRRKKSGIFQLQNFKEYKGKAFSDNKNDFLGKKKNIKDIHSFFSFPEQQYLQSNSFTLAQQQFAFEGHAPKVGIDNLSEKVLSEQKQTPLMTKTSDKDEKGSKKKHSQYYTKVWADQSQDKGMAFSKLKADTNLGFVGQQSKVRTANIGDSLKGLSPFVRDYFSFSYLKQNLYLLDKKNNLFSPKNALLTKKEYTDEKCSMQRSLKKNIDSWLRREAKAKTLKVTKTKQYISYKNREDKEPFYQKKNFSFSFPNFNPFFCESIFLYKKSRIYLNIHLLQFVIKNNYIEEKKSVNNQNRCTVGESTKYSIKHFNKYDTVKERGQKQTQTQNIYDKITVDRFFVRYLLAQFYINYLQNKEKYNTESLSLLYRFRVFFQEKHVENNVFLNKYRNFKDNNGINSFSLNRGAIFTNVTENDRNNDKKGFGIKRSVFQSTKNDLESLSKKNNLLHYPAKANEVGKGVYFSNTVYKSHLEYTLSKQYSSFYNINFFRTLIEKQSACFLVQEIIHYLERKIPFRRIKTQILRDIPHYKNIKGIRIKCSGRVGGRSKKAQRSKTQSVKIGQTSLGVFSSKIDFACKSAYTRFGLIGVKVWVCYQ